MGILKGKSEGGSGGKRGHSNMDHWVTTAELKDASRKRRRLDAKDVITEQGVDELTSHRDYCRSCKGNWGVPDGAATPELRERVATVARAGSLIDAMHLLRAAGYDLSAAKATVTHLSNPEGHCHRCRRLLSAELDAECSFCHSLNYRW